MAARLAGFTETTAVLGGTKVQKVRQWQAFSQPSETYFEIRARVVTTRAQVQTIANTFSEQIERILSTPGYTDVVWSQDVTPGGQLKSIFTIYYTDEAADESVFWEVPAGQLGGVVDGGGGGGGGTSGGGPSGGAANEL
ncbi:MAG TPA: hypothetical protein VNC18_17520 [Gemmatimonadaceae bacterium]|jgi:hypothetical protein|nr:hypothetical protein [Gemmatimonadaceae bacterium]